MTQNKSYLIAITGSIATGKSTVSKILSKMGYFVIDFDKISHDLLEYNESIKNEIIKNFGKEILDEENKINRRYLGSLVFNNKEKLKLLNKIMHDCIYQVAGQIITDKNELELIFLEIPILFETKDKYQWFYKMIDEIWLVTTDKHIQISRLMDRDKINFQEAIKRIDAQISLEEKEKLSDIIISNSNGEKNLVKAISEEIKLLKDRLIINE